MFLLRKIVKHRTMALSEKAIDMNKYEIGDYGEATFICKKDGNIQLTVTAE